MKHLLAGLIAALGLLVFCDPSASASESSYRLGPGDVLEISVWRDESLTREILLPPDGRLSFPLINDIDAAGLTIPELRKIIEQGLAPFVPDTPISVFLRSPASLRAYVIGKVNKPGLFAIGLDTSVIQILAMAGGLNPYADADKILVLRQKGSETEKISFDYNEVKKGRNLQQNILLQRGDVVVVP